MSRSHVAQKPKVGLAESVSALKTAAIFTGTGAGPFLECAMKGAAFGKTQFSGNVRNAQLGVAE